jgi:hypothetical protein
MQQRLGLPLLGVGGVGIEEEGIIEAAQRFLVAPKSEQEVAVLTDDPDIEGRQGRGFDDVGLGG